MTTPSLPQRLSADELTIRKQELQKNQSLYTYISPEILPGVAFIKGPVDKLPGQMPSFWWVLKVGIAFTKVLLNFSNFSPSRIFHALEVFWDSIFVNQKDSKQVDNALQKIYSKNDTKVLAEEALQRFKKAQRNGSTFEEKNEILDPYREMFYLLEQPKIANNFLEDCVFSRLRVAGYNPTSLFRVNDESEIPFAIDVDRMPCVGDSAATAAAEKRLYAVDFSFLKGVDQAPNSAKRFVPTKALFAIPPGGGDLQPVAIQLQDDVIYAPRKFAKPDTRWAIAKMAVNNGDAIHHELIAHLGRTHLLVEPFVAATMRQLASSHPLHVLFKPHFEGTVFINDRATSNLVTPGGSIDNVFAGDLCSLMKWTAKQVVNNKFNASMPDVEMQTRGVDDDILYFPYREDALDHFHALLEWVHAYLSHYYKSDADVVQDSELQRWVEELWDPKRGRLLDFGDDGDGSIRSVAYLARAVAFVIFSGSVQHASVNFPQRELMSYAPAVTFALWSQLPKHDNEAGLDEWREMLTPIKVAIEQVQMQNVLGAVYYTQLGHYRHCEIPRDQPIQDALQRYKAKLRAIDEKIRGRECGEQLPYEYLRPGRVPQSINI